MDKIPQPMTSSFLLNSGYYTKVNFQQMMTQLNNIDENTPYIAGFKYMPSFHVNNKDIPEVIRPVKITGTHSYRNNPVIVYVDDRGKKFETEEDLWSNNPNSKDGIYILSPEIQNRWKEEEVIFDQATNKRSLISKLPNDTINKILSRNNPLYVRKEQSTRSPLGKISNNKKKGGRTRKRSKKKSSRKNMYVSRKSKKSKKSKKSRKSRKGRKGGVAPRPRTVQDFLEETSLIDVIEDQLRDHWPSPTSYPAYIQEAFIVIKNIDMIETLHRDEKLHYFFRFLVLPRFQTAVRHDFAGNWGLIERHLRTGETARIIDELRTTNPELSSDYQQYIAHMGRLRTTSRLRLDVNPSIG